MNIELKNKIISVLSDLLWDHSDNTSPFYNDCDVELCSLCEQSLDILNEIDTLEDE